MASELTRLETIGKVADSMGRSLTGTVRSGNTLQSLLEEMYEWSKLKLSRAYSFPELDIRDTTTADTVADTFTYSFTTLFGATHRTKDIRAVVIENGTSSVRLTQLLETQLYKEVPYPEGESTNKPNIYVRLGNNLQLFPVPDAAYDIHTIRSEHDSRAASDDSYSTFDFKDDLIVVGTIVEFYNYMQEFRDAKSWDRIWKSKLVEAVKPYAHPDDWSPEGRAFNSSVLSFGDFWNDPLVLGNL